jgi:prepilin peptidase CpaA
MGHHSKGSARMAFGYWETTWAVLIPGILYASWIDYSQRRVPNWLNATLAAAGLLAQATHFGWQGVGAGLLGMLIGLSVLIVPWLMHGMGAGDVKLMAAIGCWLGPWLTLLSFAAGTIIGGCVAIIMIVSTGRTAHALVNMQTIMLKMRSGNTAFSEFGGARTFGVTSQLLPYGVPLTTGTLAVLSTYYFGGWLT